MPNLLAGQPSAYLQRAARQPVHWLPWGDDAFKKAREERKPILLDIGAVWCHWCHVMDRESYESADVAALINEKFVPVKVDRDMRPDVDRRYQEAVQSLSGQGGWPLTVFLDAEGRAFYGGTYFPPEARFGLPGFRQLLEEIDYAVHHAPQKIEAIRDVMNQGPAPPPVPTKPEERMLREAAQGLLNFFDDANGGFGHAPKFPNAEALLFLAHLSGAQADPKYLEPVLLTLRRMTDGGVYDQLGGGFHRYSTDAAWTVPHFEKMLSDNALLLRLMADVHAQTGAAWLAERIEETVEFLLRDLRGPDGAFRASQDADTDGKEGEFFVWSAEEARQTLTAEEDAVATAFFGLEAPNFEGHSVLRVASSLEAVAQAQKIPLSRATELLASAKAKLFAKRMRRRPPFIDPTIHLGWNALAISGLSAAALALARPEWAQAARRAADFIEASLRADGYAHSAVGRNTSGPAFSDDYLAYSEGLFMLYEAAQDPALLERARAALDGAVARFYDRGFYFSADKERGLWPERPIHDYSTPSANGLGLRVLAVAAGQFPDAHYAHLAGEVASLFAEPALNMPLHAGTFLGGLLRHMREPLVFVLTGPPPDPHFLQVLAGVPHRLIVRKPHPVAADKPPAERATVYVCAGTRCLPPATTPAELEDRLREIAKTGQ